MIKQQKVDIRHLLVLLLEQLFSWGVQWQNLRLNVELTHLTVKEFGKLATAVENGHLFRIQQIIDFAVVFAAAFVVIGQITGAI